MRAFRVQRRPVLALAFKKIGDALFVLAGAHFRRLIFGARLAATQVVEAYIGDDAVEPGVKAALEAEAMEIAVDLEESFLVNVPGVFRAFHQVQRQPENVAVKAANQLLESGPAACLRFCDQCSLVEVGQRDHRSQGRVRAARATVVISQC
jgi:hypothetical protein